MQNLFGLLFFILLILSIVGIFKPSVIKQTSRLKGFLFPFTAAFFSLAMVGVFAPQSAKIKNNATVEKVLKKTEVAPVATEPKKVEKKKELPNLGELMSRTWKPPFSTETIEKWGNPETLEGTNNKVWIAYFPKGNFTILSQKGDHQVLDFVKEGKVLDWSKELKILGLDKKREWYADGTLHNATVLEWKKATYENKLATTADWLISVPQIRAKLEDGSRTVDSIKPFAESIVSCVDTAVKLMKNSDKANKAGAVCLAGATGN